MNHGELLQRIANTLKGDVGPAIADEYPKTQAFMAAVVLHEESRLTPEGFEAFLAEQPDLSPKAWPRYVRITADLPTTATHKVLKRELAAEGPTAGNGQLWVREPRGTQYSRAN